MVKKFSNKFQKGFIFTPIIIAILAIIVGGTVGIVKFNQIENKNKVISTEFIQQARQLYQINLGVRQLKEKIARYQKLGIETSEVEKAQKQVRNLILENNFEDTQKLLSELNEKLEQKVEEKKEVERKATTDVKLALEAKIVDLKKKGVNVAEVDAKLSQVRGLIDSGELALAREQIATLSARLDQLLTLKLEEERKAQEATKVAAVSQNVGGINYSRKTVSTSRGNFTVDVLTIDLNQIRVITDTANLDDCNDSCPTKPLASYVSENGGVAGINGTYFCPPDYSSCAGEVASFDFPVYNTKLGKFINARTLFWSGRAMIAFDVSGKPYFFREANSFGGINIRAAIINYPALLSGGQIVVDELGLPDNLGKLKGNRGALGFSGNTLFGVISRGATVGDMAHVLKALGAEHAMNLDGGGSSALYFNGSYKVGPGRSLPNAVIFAR